MKTWKAKPTALILHRGSLALLAGAKMPYYPIFVDVKQKRVVVVGGGLVAQRKVKNLLEFGASIYIIAEKLTPTLQQYVKRGQVQLFGRVFTQSCLERAFLVFAATSDPLLNARIAEVAKRRGILVNAVDQPAECDFIVPSTFRRGDLLIAVSTSGKSPALAKRIRQKLEKEFGREYESFLALMGRLRREILQRDLSQDRRRRLFQSLVDSRIPEKIEKKDWKGISTVLSGILGREISQTDVLDYLRTG